MKKEIAKSFLSLKTAIKKHSPEILTGIGIAGMITTTVMAVRATPKALILIEERKEEIGAEKLEAMDMVKTTWALYFGSDYRNTLCCLPDRSQLSECSKKCCTCNSIYLIRIRTQRLSGKSN